MTDASADLGARGIRRGSEPGTPGNSRPTLRPLREAGLVHAQLEQLWGLATGALAKL